jgi:hypothetical protein
MTAHAHAFDPQTGEVLPHPASTVPRAALDHANAEIARLTHELEAVTGERDAIVKSAGVKHRRIRELQAELADLLDQTADRDTVLEFLRFWARTTGRDGSTDLPRSPLRVSSRNAYWFRQVLAHGYTPRDACVALIGLLQSRFHVEKELTHFAFACSKRDHWDEAVFEKHLRYGRLALSEGETA